MTDEQRKAKKQYIKKLKLKFYYKMLTKYFLYGYLLIIAVFLLVLVCLKLLHLNSFLKYSSLLCLILIVICLKYLVRIILSTKMKWKYYKVNTYRLKNKEFDDYWFCKEMYEPCMRLIIKDLCYEYDYEDEYKKMYDAYSHENYVVQQRKKELIAEMKQRDIIKNKVYDKGEHKNEN